MTTPAEADTKSAVKTIGLVIIVLFAACLIYYIVWLLLRHQPDNSIPIFGQIGDAMGPLTGLVSTLALAAAIWSISIQRRELELQREELRLIRKEHEESREVLKKQEEAQAKQAELLDSANTLAAQANTINNGIIDITRRQTRINIHGSINQIVLERHRILNDVGVAIENLRHNPHVIQTGDMTSIKKLQSDLEKTLKELDDHRGKLAELLALR